MESARPAFVPFTYDDYAVIPSDARRWEVIDGEFEVNPSPSSRHQTVSRRLQFELMKALEEPGLALVFNAPSDVILSETNVVQPDLIVIRKEHEHLVTERAIEGTPDLVVEILSPSTRVLDQRVKKGLYARFGVPEYWLVDPELGYIEQYRLADSQYYLAKRFDRVSRLTTPSFPEVDIDLARVFR